MPKTFIQSLANEDSGPYRKGRQIVVTEFEAHVIISLLETALNGWEGDQARQNAAQRVIDKLKLG